MSTAPCLVIFIIAAAAARCRHFAFVGVSVCRAVLCPSVVKKLPDDLMVLMMICSKEKTGTILPNQPARKNQTVAISTSCSI